MNRARTLVIAEAGVNHNGSLELALRLVDEAAEAGADVVKFQTFRADSLASRFAPKAEYQKRETGNEQSQLDMLRALELDEDAHRRLIERCASRGVEFLSTPFDQESLRLLTEVLGLPRLKLGSGELTNAPLVLAAARTGKPLILSTGMGTLDEVEEALGVLAFGYAADGIEPSRPAFRAAFASDAGRAALWDKVTLLHCTTEYPTPASDVNLRAMDTLRSTFGLPVGYSDHTEGTTIALAAVARGASIIEKHFTLDRSLPGPDHKASLTPAELASMVAEIRRVEAALGDGVKRPAESECKNMSVARKSLVAARAIAAGEMFGPDNLAVKRPGGGIEPLRYWELLGRPAPRAFSEDEQIQP